MKLVLLSLCLVYLSGCGKLFNSSSWEIQLSPLASALSYVQDTDLLESDVKLPILRNEFEITPVQAKKVLAKIRLRMGTVVAPIDLPILPSYRIFLTREIDPIVQRARIQHGQPRLYVVTIYIADESGHLDRSTAPFVCL